MSYHTASGFINKLGYMFMTPHKQIQENHTPEDAAEIIKLLTEDKPDTITVSGYFGDKEITKDEFIKEWVEHAGQLMRISYDMGWMESVSKIKISVENACKKEFDRLYHENACKKEFDRLYHERIKDLDLYEIYTCNESDITEGCYEGKKAGEVTGWDIKWVLSTDEQIENYPFFDTIITKNDNSTGRRIGAIVFPTI